MTYIHMGFIDTFVAADTVTDGLYFNITGNTTVMPAGSFNITGVAKANNVETVTTPSFLGKNGTWYEFAIYVQSTSLATFYIYNDTTGELLWNATVTSNIPTTTGRETSVGLICATVGGTTAQRVCQADMFGVGINRSVIR